jgi:hypothetical protein
MQDDPRLTTKPVRMRIGVGPSPGALFFLGCVGLFAVVFALVLRG